MHALSRTFTVTALALALAGAAGCDNTNTTGSSVASTTTPSVTVTESFTGTVIAKGAVTFPFAVSAAGTVTAVYSAITPNSSQVLGLALGTWNGTSCGVIIANDAATTNVTVAGATTAAGNLCVRVYDVGKLTETQTFTLLVTHQ